jgi:hypothetical protein
MQSQVQGTELIGVFAVNCFVIMPFDREFEDVYATIKSSVESATASASGRCFRLDESQPAGRITDRLLRELESASVCIADLTGNKPNVMWELGYAMALGRPAIIITQRLSDLPFDIRDMQSLEYDRKRLSSTLGIPLRKVVIDTISAHRRESSVTDSEQALVGQLLSEVAELKGMVAQAVRAWNPAPQLQTNETRQLLVGLEGAWYNRETGSNVYAKIVNDELIAPYCFASDDHLTGVYFGWRKTGEYWFARYAWLNKRLSGFSFLKEESVDLLSGAWWEDDYDQPATPNLPPDKKGVLATWDRIPAKQFPDWANTFFADVEQHGLPHQVITRLQPTT